MISILTVSSMYGCVTNSDIRREMDSLIGLPVNKVVQILGLPESSVELQGAKVLVWKNMSQDVMVSQNQFTQNTTFYSSNKQCIFSLVIDPDFEVVKSWEYRGSDSSCRPFFNRVSSFIRGNEKTQTTELNEKERSYNKCTESCYEENKSNNGEKESYAKCLEAC